MIDVFDFRNLTADAAGPLSATVATRNFRGTKVTNVNSDTSSILEGDDGRRGLRCMEWSWDPDPGDETSTVDYAFLSRDGSDVHAVHDRPIEGLFSGHVRLRTLRRRFSAATKLSPIAFVQRLRIEEAKLRLGARAALTASCASATT